MLKGDLSREPTLLCMVDYRILIDRKAPIHWIEEMFPGTIPCHFSLKPGARDWIARNWNVYFGVFSIDSAKYSQTIVELINDFISEYQDFANSESFRRYVDLNSERLLRVYTNDLSLLGLDELIQKHGGWTEEIYTHGLRNNSINKNYRGRLHKRSNRRRI
jgi:hypothetical protein